MPNLQGASPVGRDEGDYSYIAQTISRGVRGQARARRVNGELQEWRWRVDAIDWHSKDLVSTSRGIIEAE